MVQKVDDADDSIPLAKVSLLIREKNLSEATQLLQVRDPSKREKWKFFVFRERNLLKMANKNVFQSTVD